jgi:ergothioneine biosynthesis protein EgtB
MPTEAMAIDVATERDALLGHFCRVRQASVAMCRPLEPEAYRIQPIEDVSPPWWNLGHTSWFFVRNVIEPFGERREPEDAELDYVLNSYYVALGPRIARCSRGLLTRPTTDEIYRYRESVDERVEHLLKTIDERQWADLAERVTIGIHHEQQHQELFYTEIKYILAQNPPNLRKGYSDPLQSPSVEPNNFRSTYTEFDAGLFTFGHQEGGWCWDNELPVHRQYLPRFALAARLVTNGEYLAFVEDGGYRQPLLWLDNGWQCVERAGWRSPLYWEQVEGAWQVWTLAGLRPLELDEPVCHVSFYEADAYARWASQTFAEQAGARLPSEREWEHAARTHRRGQSHFCGVLPQKLGQSPEPADAFVESGRLHPAPDDGGRGLRQLAGVLWQWTASYYEPYPGYRPFPGTLAEYNGKFMDNQRVLRGGSCVMPRDHFRLSYRNFWAAPTRFQFTGIRLAQDRED